MHFYIFNALDEDNGSSVVLRMISSPIPKIEAKALSDAPSPVRSIFLNALTNSFECTAPDKTSFPPMTKFGI